MESYIFNILKYYFQNFEIYFSYSNSSLKWSLSTKKFIVSLEKYTAEQGIAPVALGITAFCEFSLAPLPTNDYDVHLYARGDAFSYASDNKALRLKLARE